MFEHLTTSFAGNPTEAETQEISHIWQSSLFNAQYETQRSVEILFGCFVQTFFLCVCTILACFMTFGKVQVRLDCCRYVVGDNRVLFMLKDGSKAWEIKDYLTTQDQCEMVTIEGRDYFGKGHPSYEAPEKVRGSDVTSRSLD